MHAAASGLQLQARAPAAAQNPQLHSSRGLPALLQLQAAKSAATGGTAGGGRRPAAAGGLCKQQGARAGQAGRQGACHARQGGTL